MKLSQFDYQVPEELIAKYPLKEREDARLMVVDRKSGKIEHKKFGDILDYFNEGDVLVANNTKVFPAMMYGRKEKTGARIEVFLLRELNSDMRLWDVLVDPARKIRVGNKLYFGEDDMLVAEVIDNTTSRGRTIRFLHDGDYDEFMTLLKSLGQTPLPPYLEREAEAIDEERYQTIFAKVEGAVAAPNAGLHFSEKLLKLTQLKGMELAEVTLHVGNGTFRQIEVEDLSKHKMDAEYYKVDRQAVEIVNNAKAAGHKVISIGTSTMRALESSVSAMGKLKPGEGWTNLFMHPPYEFSIADAMIANFYPPKSSMMITSASFAGYDLLMEIYQLAIKEKYRFYAYGDALLIL